MFYLYFQRFYGRNLIVMVLLGLSLLLTKHVYAQGHTFRLLPDPTVTSSMNNAYFVYNEETTAQKVIQDSVLVVNTGSEPVRLALYASDATTANNGGVAIGTQFGDLPSKTGTWLQLSESELTLEPSEQRSVSFTATIPDGVAAGEYAATIVTQEAESSDAAEQSGTFGVRFIPQAAATVLMTVPGAEGLQPQLEITQLQTEISNGRQVVLAELHNTGNDGLDNSEGTLAIRDTAGTVVQEIPVRLGYFLAGDTLTYRASLDSALEPGDYDVTLSLASQDQRVEESARLSLAAVEEIREVTTADEVIVVQATPVPPTAASPESNTFLPTWIFIAGAGGVVFVLLLLILIVMRQIRISNQARA